MKTIKIIIDPVKQIKKISRTGFSDSRKTNTQIIKNKKKYTRKIKHKRILYV